MLLITPPIDFFVGWLFFIRLSVYKNYLIIRGDSLLLNSTLTL